MTPDILSQLGENIETTFFVFGVLIFAIELAEVLFKGSHKGKKLLETIGKLGPLEWVLNTPSHHRVHHGSDRKYLDKNYAGILIIWDRMFGSFQEEEETPRYGLTTDFDSQNPLRVWTSELPELGRDLKRAKSASDVAGYLFKGPGWRPKKQTPAE